ncbi:colicin immunity domain-containing protein [Bergeyella sp. RCAD1439]|uniref:colicin immunity domain-containing protein n=1 Tax=Bergeyella anatis TaxID=3113737 RepID=UPI002E1768AB|nr:colicin immunity domain-containing protein [Bergeyella sp. RCAD1439]
MYKKDDKRRLYQLMDMFVMSQITASVFCNEFYYSYDLEIDSDTLSNEEQQAFSDLSIVSSRFSQFKEDHEKYPNGFFTEEELRQKIIETKEKLQSQSPIK